MIRINIKTCIIILGVLLFTKNIKAQDSLVSAHSSNRLLLENQWLNTNNIAGAVFNPFLADGDFVLGYTTKKGDLKYTQLSSDEETYSFNAEKSALINNTFFSGHIGYQNMQQKDVGWTARMNPITHNPYMLGDSIFGLYQKDYIDIGGGFGYLISDRLSAGINVNCSFADAARIKDPRPQNKFFTLEAFPSVIYSFDKFKLGVNFHFITGKEIINYVVLNDGYAYDMFMTLGLGKTVKAKQIGLHTRNYYLSGLGGELQTQYSVANIKALSGIGYFSQTEKSEDRPSNPDKRHTGDFKENTYRFYSIFNFRKNLIHSFSINMDVLSGQGTEFLQESYHKWTETYFRTIAEIDNYSILELIPSIKYTVAKPHNDYLNNWEINFNAQMDNFKAEYLLEAEESYTNIMGSIEFDKAFYFKKSMFGFSISGGLIYNLSNELKQLRKYTAEQEIAMWENVIEPDFLINTSTIYDIGAKVRYGRNVDILKDRNSLVYLDLGVNYKSGSNNLWIENKSFEVYSFKIGITY
jgi:hypothetical protein